MLAFLINIKKLKLLYLVVNIIRFIHHASKYQKFNMFIIRETLPKRIIIYKMLKSHKIC